MKKCMSVRPVREAGTPHPDVTFNPHPPNGQRSQNVTGANLHTSTNATHVVGNKKSVKWERGGGLCKTDNMRYLFWGRGGVKAPLPEHMANHSPQIRRD